MVKWFRQRHFHVYSDWSDSGRPGWWQFKSCGICGKIKTRQLA